MRLAIQIVISIRSDENGRPTALYNPLLSALRFFFLICNILREEGRNALGLSGTFSKKKLRDFSSSVLLMMSQNWINLMNRFQNYFCITCCRLIFV